VPIYEYECRKCGIFDHTQPMSARPLARCPRCRSKVTKLISATAFHLKGGGWYADGYDRKKGGGEGEAKPEAKPEATPASTPEAAAADKPQPPSPAPSTGSGAKKKPAKSGRGSKTAAA